MTKHIARDVASVITLLGGYNKAAQILNCQTTTLRMWKTRGRIPSAWLTAHQSALSQHKAQADPAIWTGTRTYRMRQKVRR